MNHLIIVKELGLTNRIKASPHKDKNIISYAIASGSIEMMKTIVKFWNIDWNETDIVYKVFLIFLELLFTKL